MAVKSKSKQEEALQFLDDLDLDSLSPSAPPTSGTTPPVARPVNEGDAAEALAFIDEITQKSSEPTRQATAAHLDRPLSRAATPTGTLRKTTERVRVGTPTPAAAPSAEGASSSLAASSSVASEASTAGGSAGSWGWGSVWSSASAAIQQARTVVDEQVKNLPQTEQARKWSEGVMEYAKTAQLEKLGQDFKRVGLSTLNDILNVVAPPISEHEVIHVWISHDMQGYEGVESLVYRALARIMEQVEGGDLVVNKGNESRPREASQSKRELNAVESYDAALKLAQANLDELIKKNVKPPQSPNTNAQNPTVNSYVYLRIQPYLATLPAGPSAEPTQNYLHFILLFSDPTHELVHITTTQAVPAKWLDLWDKYEFVEDSVVDVLRLGVEVIGQEYIVSRMGWGVDSTSEVVPEVAGANEPEMAA